jgi:hypothetical protein
MKDLQHSKKLCDELYHKAFDDDSKDGVVNTTGNKEESMGEPK